MKKVFITMLVPLLVGLFVSTSWATALSTYWDLGVYAFGAPGNTLTGDFDRISYEADTTSTQYDTDGDGFLSIGDKFTDQGNAYVDSLQGSGTSAFSNGLNLDLFGLTGYVVTFGWTNLDGEVFDINPGVTTDAVVTKYQSGTINFYLDYVTNGTPSLGSSYSISDDTNFLQGQAIATIDVTGGTGNATFTHNSLDFLTGSFNITGKFTSLLDNFWYEAGTLQDLNEKYVSLEWLVGFTSGDTTDRRFTQTLLGGGSDPLYVIDSRHSSNFELAVVPEPSTILLLGAGLLGLGFIARRRKS